MKSEEIYNRGVPSQIRGLLSLRGLLSPFLSQKNKNKNKNPLTPIFSFAIPFSHLFATPKE